MKKKGKVIITKPTKSSTVVFTRGSRNKADKDGGDIIFRRNLPTFQVRLKELEARASIKNFKALKYETWTDDEQKKIEDLVMDKMGKWKYSLDQLISQIPNVVMEKIKPRWEFFHANYQGHLWENPEVAYIEHIRCRGKRVTKEE